MGRPTRFDPDPRRLSPLQATVQQARALAKRNTKFRMLGGEDEHLGFGEPSVERGAEGKMYLRTPAGHRWRLHDVRLRANGTLERMPLMHRDATHRAFVHEDESVVKLYQFAPREGRGLSGAHCFAQLNAAEVRR